MKKFIGRIIMKIGARLWEKGRIWTCDDCEVIKVVDYMDYKNLTTTGKLGYKMVCTGLDLCGFTHNDVNKITNTTT